MFVFAFIIILRAEVGNGSGTIRSTPERAKLAHLTGHLPQALWDAFLGTWLCRPRVKAISERAVIGSLLLGFLVRGLFTLHVADQLDAQGQPLSYTDTDIPVSAADIPDLSCRNLFLQLCRGLPGDGENTQPSAAVAAVLAAHPDLCARLEAIPRHLSDTNMVDHVGQQLQTAFGNILTLLFAGRLKKSVSLAGAKVLLGTNEHQRRFGCRARHIFIDTRGLYGLMSDAGMLGVLTEQGVTSVASSGTVPYLTQRVRATTLKGLQTASVMFLRPKPAAPPAELPRMSKGMGAVNPLAHLHAEWLGVDPGKTNMATVAHEERSADGSVVSVRHWTLTAGQYYRDSGITRQTQATKIVSSKPSSLASYRRFADTVLETYDAMWAEVSKKRWANAKFRLYCGKMRVVASFWAKVKKQAQKLWLDRILALAYHSYNLGLSCRSDGAAGFNGSGTIGCRGVPVSQMRKEAVKQFRPERVVLVDEFRASRVSSADNTPSETLLDTPPESFRWLRPVKSMAKRSQVRGLMCSTSINNITRFYDRDVSAALNIRRCAVGPGPRPTELCYWTNRPAMPKPGQPGQERGEPRPSYNSRQSQQKKTMNP
ncbi:hypothetical protein QJQ45_025628 [Haematococcus lacustris]|nr:hypothetical protein QJQ45_025628 [Haematococcus lacustris]